MSKQPQNSFKERLLKSRQTNETFQANNGKRDNKQYTSLGRSSAPLINLEHPESYPSILLPDERIKYAC